MAAEQHSISDEEIAPRILLIRGLRVLLDADLALLYETSTKVLSQPSNGSRSGFRRILCSSSRAKSRRV